MSENIINSWQSYSILLKDVVSKEMTIFVADDSELILKSLEKFLRNYNYVIELFRTIETLEKRLVEKTPDIILLDIYFQDNDSFEFMEKYANKTPIICMSSSETGEDMTKAFFYGVADYIPKPVNVELMKLKIDSFVNRMYLLKNYEDMSKFIDSLLYTIEIRDSYTKGHAERVSEIAVKISKEIGLSKEEVDFVRKGALLHDIGKIGVRDVVLLKEGRLTDDEYVEIKNHTIYGFNICEKLESFRPFLNIIRNHHEKLNGTGYPDGLKYEEIPLTTHIVSIADVFDALTSKRVYRDAMSYEEAMKILWDEAKKGYWDLNLITVLKNIIKNEKDI